METGKMAVLELLETLKSKAKQAGLWNMFYRMKNSVQAYQFKNMRILLN